MNLVCRDLEFASACEALALKHAWQLEAKEPSTGLYLLFHQGRLSLRKASSKLGPLYVDFLSGELAHLWRSGVGQRDLMARALGVRKGVKRVVDATAGLGHDTLMLLLLGCEVTAVERGPEIFALLEDGLRRGLTNPQWASQFSGRLKLLGEDSFQYLTEFTSVDRRDERPDAVYLDPMFPEKKKSAASGLEMQYLRELLGEPDDLAPLLRVAREIARHRVVLKRPLRAPVEHSPSLSFAGRSIRYDVWLS